jgi:hypothetical protein
MNSHHLVRTSGAPESTVPEGSIACAMENLLLAAKQ